MVILHGYVNLPEGKTLPIGLQRATVLALQHWPALASAGHSHGALPWLFGEPGDAFPG